MSAADEQRAPDQLPGVLPPEQQEEVIGHAPARATIAELIDGARLPGAFLLHGPQGIGKATLAFATACEVLARTGDEAPERVIEQVRMLAHPNLFVLRRQLRDTGRGYYTVIRVDDVRDLRERMRRTRGRPGHRVAVIDPIDECNPNAANALLKLLEEPPPETLFLLVSHRPRSLLPTIRSRCQSIALRPLGEDDVRRVLLRQRPDAGGSAFERAIELAEGRPRRGFEALGMAEDSAVGALRGWLADPLRHPVSIHLALADGLAAGRDGVELAFARDVLRDWIAAEAYAAATGGGIDRRRLASVNELWEKANASFADTDEYNLDARQTLIEVFDAIRRHVQETASAEPR